MVRDIDFLESMCERMQQVGLVESKTAFSCRMLGKGPSYLTSMKARDRCVSGDVMDTFRQRLDDDAAAAEVVIALLRDRLGDLERQQRHRVDLLHHVEGRMSTTTSDEASETPHERTISPFAKWLLIRARRLRCLVAHNLLPRH